MALTDKHPLYAANIDTWAMVRDCCAGNRAIKSKEKIYLPDFVPSQGDDRYQSYLLHAVYTNFTGRTKQRLIGSVFRKPPEVELPTALNYMLEDCTQTGLSLTQFSKIGCNEVFETGRAGILVDYPEAEGTESLQIVRDKNLLPRFALYAAESIYNWRSKWIDGKEFLVQVRLEEIIEQEIDEFNVKYVKQYRVLDLDENGFYRQRIYDESQKLIKEFWPLAAGSKLNHIPFSFAGAHTNASSIDVSPLYDLAVINLSHYQNSADYEDAIHRWSPTLFVSADISPEQFKSANPNGIIVGGNTGHFLGPNGRAELLQMQPNTSALEAMKLKEEQMSSFGSNLFNFEGQNQTAEEARIKATSEASTMNLIVGNISECISSALNDAALFVGIKDAKIDFKLNTEFFPVELTTAEITSLVGLVEKGIIGLTDLRDKLRHTEVISPDRSDKDLDADTDNVLRNDAIDKQKTDAQKNTFVNK